MRSHYAVCRLRCFPREVELWDRAVGWNCGFRRWGASVAINLSTFLAYTTAGSLAWASVLTWAGYLLEKNYTTVGKYIDPTAKAIVASRLVVYIYRVVTHQK